MNRSLAFFVALLMLFGGGMLIWYVYQHAQPVARTGPTQAPLDPNRKLETFELTERSGKPFASADFAGHPWIANFFFARCPQNCWRQSQKVAELYRAYAEKGVRFVSITVDPENDAPSELDKYAQRLGVGDANWVFLTGDFVYIQKVGKDMFSVPVTHNGHSEQLMLVDADGKLRRYYNWEDEEQVNLLRRDLNRLLRGERLENE